MGRAWRAPTSRFFCDTGAAPGREDWRRMGMGRHGRHRVGEVRGVYPFIIIFSSRLSYYIPSVFLSFLTLVLRLSVSLLYTHFTSSLAWRHFPSSVLDLPYTLRFPDLSLSTYFLRSSPYTHAPPLHLPWLPCFACIYISDPPMWAHIAFVSALSTPR
jgi:hypothetical protein